MAQMERAPQKKIKYRESGLETGIKPTRTYPIIVPANSTDTTSALMEDTLLVILNADATMRPKKKDHTIYGYLKSRKEMILERVSIAIAIPDNTGRRIPNGTCSKASLILKEKIERINRLSNDLIALIKSS